MADQIKAASIIEPQVKKEFQELLKLVDAMVSKFKEVQVAAKATDAELKKGIKTNQDFGKAKKEVVGASQMLSDIEKEEQKLREKHYQLIVKATAAESKAGKEYLKTTEDLKQKNIAQREAAKVADAESNSINRLIQRNKDLTKERNKVNTATKEGQKRIQGINAEINRNNKTINANTSSLEKQKNNVGNYVSAFKNVGTQLLALTGITIGLRGAMQLFDKVMMSTQATGDKLTHAKAALGGAFNSLFRTIAQGDFTFKTLIENMKNGYTAAKNYSIALDEIGDIMRAVDLRAEESMDKLDELRVVMSETETKTLAERKKALVEYEKINNEILESRTNAANEIIKAERNRLKDDYKLTDEQVALVENFVRNYDKLTNTQLKNVQRVIDAREKEKRTIELVEESLIDISSGRLSDMSQRQKAEIKILGEKYRQEKSLLSESEQAYYSLNSVIDGLVDVQRNQIADALKGIATANRAFSAAQRVAVRRQQQLVIEEQKAADEQSKIAKDLANQKAAADKDYLDQKRSIQAYEDKITKETNAENLQEYKDLQQEQLNALTQRFIDGKISAKAYADELLTIQVTSLEQQLQYAKDNGLEVLTYETQLLALKKQLKDQETEHFVQSEEKKRLSSMETLQQLGKIFTESTNLFAALNDSQLQQLEEKKNYELELAGESALGKKAAEQSYAKEVAKIKRKQAIADRAAALFDIAISTAVGVASATKTPLLIPYIISLGALQATTVLATPIPKFYKGVRNFEGGMALVGEQGDEIYRTPDNQLGITPNQATLMALPRGTDVYTHSESKQMMANNNIDVSELVKEQRKTRQAIASKSEYHTHLDKDGLKVLLRKGNNSITYADKYLRF